MRQQATETTQQPTVGDTVRVIHRVAAPADALVQPRPPTDSLLATLVAPPVVQREGDSVRIAYTVALWSPGRNTLTIPGPVLLRPDGRVDTLADVRVQLAVASVLPEGVTAESLPPRQARPWVARGERSLMPVVVVMVPVLLGLAVAALWWRRRGPPMPTRGGPPMPLARHRERIVAWRDAGEATLAVDHLGAMLVDGEAARAWRERVAAVRYRADAERELVALIAEGLDLLGDAGGAR